MMNLRNIFRIVKYEGLKTFDYCVREKISDITSDERRYAAYIKSVEPQLNKEIIPSKEVSLDIIRINNIDCMMALFQSPQWQEISCDDYVGFVFDGQVLENNIEKVISSYISKYNLLDEVVDIIYSDEDMIKPDGKRYSPIFKPEYSPETLLSYDYIGGFWCAKKGIIDKVLKNIRFTSYELISYEILLKILIGNSYNVKHINRVLLHNEYEKKYSDEDMRSLSSYKEELLLSIGQKVTVENVINKPVQHLYYELSKKILVSVVIPSKDNPKILKQCLDSIVRYTFCTNYEIIVVDNGSSEINKEKYKRLLDSYKKNTKYIYEKRDFNFSYMCNVGADKAIGNVLLFLNDDVEVLRQNIHFLNDNDKMDWMGILATQALLPESGAVGAKLLYPNSNKIQHIGVVNYATSCFAHIYSKSEDDSSIKDYRNCADYNYLCVTGACIMLEAKKFKQVNGFDEKLAVTHNDIDLCIKLYESGYRQVQRNDIVLVHHESLTRGDDGLDEIKDKRNMLEREYLYLKHPMFERYDPYYSPNLTQREFQCQINDAFEGLFVSKGRKISIDNVEKIIRNKKNIALCHGTIVSVRHCEDINILGYAYGEKKIYNPILILYNSERAYAVQATSICDRVFHKRKNLDKNMNFATFYIKLDRREVCQGKYNILIYKKNRFYLLGKDVII